MRGNNIDVFVLEERKPV